MDDLLADFVAETREMLEASEGEIIAWEADPADRARLDSIFRFVHTVKGNCGFFDFPRLAQLSHAAEDALADVRAGRRSADSALVSAVLAIIDRIAEMVDAIEESAEIARAVIDGAILPLVGLPSGALPSDKLRLLRLSDGGSELLLAVREIEDATDLTDKLKPVPEDPLIEAVTLVDGQQVTLLNGHELFARRGEPPEVVDRPLCRLPDSDWARSILGPLVQAAGYQVIDKDAGGEDAITIVFEDIYEVAKALDEPFKGPVIRLRDLPDAPAHENTIYRYDREGIIDALRRARTGGRQ